LAYLLGVQTSRVELPFNHQDVTTLMSMIGDIRRDVQEIRRLLENEDGEGEEEVPKEPDS
jgi:hypothetical protein